MKISEFIKERKLKSHLAAGFLAHLRLNGDREMDENHLDEAYRQFAGLPERESTDAESAPESGPEPTSGNSEDSPAADSSEESGLEPTSGDSDDSPTVDSSEESSSQSRTLSTAGRSSRRRGAPSGKGIESSFEDEKQTGDE